MRNKIIILLFVSLILTSLISAEVETLPPAKQNEAKLLTQICSNCTYVSILSINDKYGDVALQSINMTKEGSYFYYSFTNTSINGEYIVNGVADVDGYETPFAYNFFVTPSGKSGVDNLVFSILILLMFYTINFIGYYSRNATLTLLSGMFLMFLGIYLINNGLVIYRDDLTNYVAYITIGWGFVSSIVAGDVLYREE